MKADTRVAYDGVIDLRDDTAARPKLGYRPMLDGLRALGIVVVIIHHLDLVRFPGGFIALDLFFVLSGFLITTLLLEQWHKRGTLALRNFYTRRVLRLAPAFAVFLTAYVVLALVVFRGSHQAVMLRSAFSAISYRANIRMAFDHSKFAAGLGGTWSLAMEEQFYLVWPLTLLALLKLRFRPRTIMVITGMGAVGFALHRAVLTLHGVPWQRVYFAPDTRGDTLLIGCLLGLLFHHGVLPDGATIRRWYRAGALAVFAAFPVAMLVLNERQRAIYTIGIPIAGLLSAALIASCLLDPPSWVRRALEHPASIRVGQLSYSLYLWHGVMIVLAMQYLPLPMLGKMAVAVTLSWIASVCSYQLVEQPFLRLKKRVAASA